MFDDDGIPEVEPSAQTFDDWGFYGTSIYLATLRLAALKAVAVMTQAAGYTQSHKLWLSMVAGVQKTIMTKFWNGEYFRPMSIGAAWELITKRK